MNSAKNDHLVTTHSLNQFINNIKPPHTLTKTYKTDPDRLLYSQLLEFSTRHLQSLQKDIPFTHNSSNAPLQYLAKHLFNPLFEEIIQLSKRECAQKGYLLKMVYDFYHSGIATIQKNCEEKTKNFIVQYNCKLDLKVSQFKKEKDQLSDKIKQMQKQTENKWKTFYMIVRDNRVLRRQKGKLLRTIHQERLKSVKSHQEMVVLARQNQKHKLLANYQQQQSLGVFLRNQMALKKMEQFMKEYPKKAKNVLLFNLKQLQIMEERALDSKIEYILKAATQTEEIFDEYEDLVDFVLPNKLLFNAATQTEQEEEEEIEPPSMTNASCQTTQPLLTVAHKQISYCVGHRHPQNLRRRRDVTANQSLKIQQVARLFSKQKLAIQKRVFSMRIYQRFTLIKNLSLCSNTVNQNLLIQCDDEDLPAPRSTLQKLSTSIRKSHQFYTKRQSISSSGSAMLKRMTVQMDKSKPTIQNNSQKPKYRNSIQINGKLQGQFQPDESMKLQECSDMDSKKLVISVKRSSTTKLRYSKQMLQTQPARLQAIEIKQQQQDENQSDKEQTDMFRASALTSMSLLKTSKKTILTTDRKDNKNHLIVSKTGNKKRTMLRKSGFAAHSNSKKSVTQQQQFRTTMKLSLQGMQSRNSEAKLHLSTNQNINYALKSTTNISMVGNERFNRQTVNQKQINLLGHQSSKLIQKVMKAVYLRRNQVAQGKITFQNFLNQYMTNHYGPQIRVLFASKITGRSDYWNPLVKAFDLLLSNYHTQPYLKYIFGLFGKLILMNNSSSIFVQEQKGQTLKHQLLKNTMGEDLSATEWGEQNCGNVCSIFMDVENRLNFMLGRCQLHDFLKMILPQSQKYLQFEEIKEMLSIFIGQKEHLEYLNLLKHYCKNDLSPIMLCGYAYREKWNKMVYFKSTIQAKYKRWFGQYNQQNVQPLMQKLQRSQRLTWTYNLLGGLISNGQGSKLSVLMVKYVCVLFTANQLQKQLPISSHLSEISQQYCISNLRKHQVLRN